ncbi:hypothetical protein, partial [Escherichia coli]|uniref:hypothetical protein n=1 Tax=Escherichia coli TaxID=562 RepID=UPI003EE259BB
KKALPFVEGMFIFYSLPFGEGCSMSDLIAYKSNALVEASYKFPHLNTLNHITFTLNHITYSIVTFCFL